ncbi:hypothetical protein ACF046_15785 [Glutamicibacter creatinolyticus]
MCVGCCRKLHYTPGSSSLFLSHAACT